MRFCSLRRLESFSIVLFAVLIVFSLFPNHALCDKSADAFVQNAIYSNKITIFSKSYCPYCKRVKRIFSELNEKPFVVELDLRGALERPRDIVSHFYYLSGIRYMAHWMSPIGDNSSDADDGKEIQNVLLDLVGTHTVPQVFVNGQHVGGSDDTVKALSNGRLHKLLLKTH